MNVFFVFSDGSLQTPPLSGTILPGITRDALMTLARSEGLKVREEPYAIDQWRADATSGRLTEAFACGTAAVVTPIREILHRGETLYKNTGDQPGALTLKLRQQLVDIQYGLIPAPEDWLVKIQ